MPAEKTTHETGRQAPLPGEPDLPLAGHLEELRRRLGVCLLAVLVGVGISLTQISRLLVWLQRPAEPMLLHFAFFTPAEPLLAMVRVAVLAGLILAMPVILWQVWGFVRGGLTPQERRYGQVFVWWGSVQFALGAALAYYVLLPASLRLLLGIGAEYFEPMISIDRYLSFVTGLAFWCGVIFELPVVLFVLAKVGIVTSEWLRQQRTYAILVLVIIAAIVTPTTDPVNLLLMTAPLVALYEGSIWVTRLAMRRA